MKINIKIKKYFENKVKLIELNRFLDNRGFFSEIYNKSILTKFGIKDSFVQDNVSYSKKNVLRGLHFQSPPFSQSKLICVLEGRILDIIVDLRKKSKTFGQYKSFDISSKKLSLLYIPHYFAHGFIVKSKSAIVHYKVSKQYSPKHEKTLLWSDKNIGINWKISNENIVISSKDKQGISLNNLLSPF